MINVRTACLGCSIVGPGLARFVPAHRLWMQYQAGSIGIRAQRLDAINASLNIDYVQGFNTKYLRCIYTSVYKPGSGTLFDQYANLQFSLSICSLHYSGQLFIKL